MNKNYIIIGVIAVVVIGVVAYFVTTSNSGASTTTTSEKTAGGSNLLNGIVKLYSGFGGGIANAAGSVLNSGTANPPVNKDVLNTSLLAMGW